jgi:hypothetical protein
MKSPKFYPTEFDIYASQPVSHLLIFRIKGTPNEKCWPGVSDLPEYDPNFTCHRIKSLRRVCPYLGKQGLDLLEVCFNPVVVVDMG